MTYDEAMRYIKGTEKLGSIPGLETIATLLDRLGNPQDRLKVIHVAGTNGKGSTISFLSGILAVAGYRVGIYISPAVFSYREKIQIRSLNKHRYDNINDNNLIHDEYISKEDVCKVLDIIKSACEDMAANGQAHPTSFEIETAMTFLYMQWAQVDFLLLETGMGGRLDATNVIGSPICSVITSVSLDHMQFLGDTLEQIAYEKAGIMKHGSCLVTSNQKPEVLRIFSDKADELDIPIIIADMSKAYDIRYNQGHTTFVYPNIDKMDNYKIHLLGKYQVVNAILAITTARMIRSLGYSVSEEAIKSGLYLAKWQGRFEQISKAPDIYIDGAHNVDAALSLQDSIEIYFTNQRLIFIIGVLADKDYKKMLSILAPLAYTIIALTPDNPRSLSSDLLAKEARVYCSNVFDEGDIDNSIERAYAEAGTGDIILAFGSLSFLGSLVSSIRLRKDESNNG
jgi:dihydrofolate synthase/folylpolyglutamate synthase